MNDDGPWYSSSRPLYDSWSQVMPLQNHRSVISVSDFPRTLRGVHTFTMPAHGLSSKTNKYCVLSTAYNLYPYHIAILWPRGTSFVNNFVAVVSFVQHGIMWIAVWRYSTDGGQQHCHNIPRKCPTNARNLVYWHIQLIVRASNFIGFAKRFPHSKQQGICMVCWWIVLVNKATSFVAFANWWICFTIATGKYFANICDIQSQ